MASGILTALYVSPALLPWRGWAGFLFFDIRFAFWSLPYHLVFSRERAFPLLSTFARFLSYHAFLLFTAFSHGDETLEDRNNEESISCYFHVLFPCLRLTFLIQQHITIHIRVVNEVFTSFHHHDIDERTPSSRRQVKGLSSLCKGNKAPLFQR